MEYFLGAIKRGKGVQELQQLQEKELVGNLEKQFGESFYVFDIKKLRSNYEKLYSAFKERYPYVTIGYSYKTNYLPALIKEMDSLGAYAEVVSRIEYDLACKIGVESERIIFNGPLKEYEDLVLALKGNSIVNLDSFYEIDLLEKFVRNHRGGPYKVGLRINFDLSEAEKGIATSRFGFCVENGNLERAIRRLHAIDEVEIVGFHGHFSTKSRSVDVYRKITEKLCELSKKYIRDTLEYIDIGGGMYGNVPSEFKLKDVPTFDDYAETVCEVLKKEWAYFKKPPRLIIEPGLAIVVDTFNFYCKVIDVKRNRDDYFVLVNGSIHNIKPTKHPRNLPMEHVKMAGGQYEQRTYHVVGYTCMETDYLAKNYESFLPKRGDYLVFSNVGAYTIVFDPQFIRERPPIIMREQNEFQVVRKREKLSDFINDNVYFFQSLLLVGAPFL
ncbi:diaminopimelate decarboxylase [Sporosarcina sp. 179-K 3D1 HS]|uniref:diaminopimelate decarboxylase n=1 Tax=Sporosarcina sp. 179-K 3D1 HS TaxID=3232169 RepID=UPI00399FC5CD